MSNNYPRPKHPEIELHNMFIDNIQKLIQNIIRIDAIDSVQKSSDPSYPHNFSVV